MTLFQRIFVIVTFALVVTALDLTNDWGPWRRWWIDFVFGNNLYDYAKVIYFVRDAIPVVLLTEIAARLVLRDSPFWILIFLVFRAGPYAKRYSIKINWKD